MSNVKRPSVLIGTPMFGGLAYYHYVGSMMDTTGYCVATGIRLKAQFIANESLIGRARNRIAQMFLASQADKLLFIDADLGWTVPDFTRIIESNKLVVGGTYPGKAFPIELMANALPEHNETFDFRVRSLEQLQELGTKYGNSRGEVEVRHVPTGFLMIDRSVFEKLKPHVRTYHSHALGTKEEVEMWDFFPSGAQPSGEYESEDWAFCRLVREHLDCRVWLSTRTVLSHTGTHTFRAGHI